MLSNKRLEKPNHYPLVFLMRNINLIRLLLAYDFNKILLFSELAQE